MFSSFQASDSPVTALSFMEGSDALFTGDEKGQITLWGAKNEQRKSYYEGRSGKIIQFVHANEMTFTTISDDGYITIWKTEDKKIYCQSNISKSLRNPSKNICARAIAQKPHTGAYVVVLDNNMGVLVWQSGTNEFQFIDRKIEPIGGNDVATSGDFMVTNSGRALFLYDMYMGKQIRMFGGTPDATAYGEDVFSPIETEKFIATKNTTAQRTGGHMDTITSLNFSPDGKWLLSGSKDKTLRLWNMAEISSGKDSMPKVFNGPKSAIIKVKYLGLFQKILAACADGTIYLWEIEKESCSSIIETGKETISSFAVDTNGTYWAAGYKDGTVQLGKIK